MDNKKQERFKKIATARTNKVLNDLRLLSNCANKNNYSYSQEEVNEILHAIDEGVRDLKAAYLAKKDRKEMFSLTKRK